MQTNEDKISFISPAFSNDAGSVRRHVHVLIGGQWFHIYGEKNGERDVYQQNGRNCRKVSAKRLAKQVIETSDRLEDTQPNIFRFS